MDNYQWPILNKVTSSLRMFFGDHTPPHFHASNNEKEGLFKIEDLEMFKGDLNSKDQKKVKKWAEPRKTKLKNHVFMYSSLKKENHHRLVTNLS